MKFDLIFEGGGAKGLVFVGAFQALTEHKHSIGRLIGTSAGAITATLLAAGYQPDDLFKAVNEKLPDGKPIFSSFMDTPVSFAQATIDESLSYQILKEVDLPLIPELVEKHVDQFIIEAMMQIPAYRHLFSFVERGGWYDGKTFLEWIRGKLNADGRNLGGATFEAFFQMTKRDLSVVVSDTSGREMLVLNHRTAPKCPVAWGVRMSMSIPFAWQEVIWQKEWGEYLGRDISGHRIVDGGLLSNFPIQLFMSRDKDALAVMGNQISENRILGLLIDETLEVPGSGEAAPVEIQKSGIKGVLDPKNLEVVQRISSLADTLLSAHDKMVIDTYADNVCRLPAKGYGTMEFDMSTERQQAIMKAGQATMEAYLVEHKL